ncbi:hypothetical protein A3E46_01820 [Candidatus Woesebacteria bacterium RIFCSPHIGHO2_12_FULL_46_16]|uniref:Uncharacterized protein n=1 Tax=Candidatus Woesebacteria bacterium RIFCSPHIGHO2_12_FULL_46_16 TaxID=1802513 RepID=A0A1F8B322_9BACT|nr:MAG: hypothetical protein A3E46_01820 [Candidatus Woesebacteria bacterium RIFCSPHIGHO2_12_FULL_46_16]
MAKRRTRKQKEEARHSFALSWSPEAKKDHSELDVKGHLKNEAGRSLGQASTTKSADLLAKETSLASIKRDILKSIFLASLILGTELVLYLAWL